MSHSSLQHIRLLSMGLKHAAGLGDAAAILSSCQTQMPQKVAAGRCAAKSGSCRSKLWADAWVVSRYGQARMYGAVAQSWSPGGLSGQMLVPLQNIGNLTAPFTMTSSGCCLTQGSGSNITCNSTGVSVSGPVSQNLRVNQIANFNFYVSECPSSALFRLCVHQAPWLAGVARMM